MPPSSSGTCCQTSLSWVAVHAPLGRVRSVAYRLERYPNLSLEPVVVHLRGGVPDTLPGPVPVVAVVEQHSIEIQTAAIDPEEVAVRPGVGRVEEQGNLLF
jgi:hypothetical protein